MRTELTVEDKDDLQVALRTIDRIIGLEYPEPTGSIIDDDAEPEVIFRWGLGDGFNMAIRGVVDEALPGWRK